MNIKCATITRTGYDLTLEQCKLFFVGKFEDALQKEYRDGSSDIMGISLVEDHYHNILWAYTHSIEYNGISVSFENILVHGLEHLEYKD